jgi:hypothetical protein
MTTHVVTAHPTVQRVLDLEALLAKKSHFLFGPRQTGKTFLVRESLPKNTRVYDLLDSSVYLDLSQHPGRIAQELTARDTVVVIDEGSCRRSTSPTTRAPTWSPTRATISSRRSWRRAPPGTCRRSAVFSA